MNLLPLLTEIGFLYPYMLWLTPVALGALVYAYLRRGRAKRIVVSSTFILQNLKRSGFGKSRFSPPLRFFFELLILTLLLLCAAGLFRLSANNRVALLIDNSISMDQRAETLSLLDLVKVDVKNYLESLPSNSLITIFTSAPALKIVDEPALRIGGALRAIEKITVQYAHDNLEQSMEALSNQSYNSVVVFTDRPGKESDKDSQNNLEESLQKVSLHSNVSIRTQTPNLRDNFAIARIALNTVGLENDSYTLTATVNSYSRTSQKLKVLLQGATLNNPILEKVEEKSIELRAGDTTQLSFDRIPQSMHGFKVSLESLDRKFDVLAADNSYYITTESKREPILLVSQFTPEALGLDKLKNFAFTRLEPTKLSSLTTIPDTVIFHRVVPEAPPSSNTLYVFPPSENRLIPLASKPVEKTAVTLWSPTHPVLQYLNVPSLNLTQVYPLALPAGAEPLINIPEGIAAYSQEHQSKRNVVLGFEVFPFEGKENRALSILILNILKWLKNSALEAGYFLASSAAPHSGSWDEASYISTEEKIVRLPSGEFYLPMPGIIKITSSSKNSLAAVNFFDGDESNLLNPRPVGLSAVTLSADSAQERRNLVAPLIFTLLVFLLLDMLFMNLRGRLSSIKLRTSNEI